MRRRVAEGTGGGGEEGFALVAALMLVTVFLMLGLASLAFVDVQQREAGRERTREAAFNLTEGVLSQQSFLLATAWPGSAAAAYPAACTEASTDDRCPSAERLAASFTGVDYDEVGWAVSVSDNGGQAKDFWSEALAAGQPRWDANGDGEMWVHAQGTARGRTRAIVARVKVESQQEIVPRAALLAGWWQTTNSGNKTIVDTNGPADRPVAQPGPVRVRCGQLAVGCLVADLLKGQVAPLLVEYGYSGGDALTPAQLGRLRATARALGTYWANGCPANPSGRLVFVERGPCTWNNSAGPCCNSADEPGVLVVADGAVTFNGNIVFHGLVYAANASRATGALVTNQGTSSVQGSILVDGQAGVLSGSSKENVVFDDRAINALRSYGQTGIVENTWREVTPS